MIHPKFQPGPSQQVDNVGDGILLASTLTVIHDDEKILGRRDRISSTHPNRE